MVAGTVWRTNCEEFGGAQPATPFGESVSSKAELAARPETVCPAPPRNWAGAVIWKPW